jgi:hypothetical protein
MQDGEVENVFLACSLSIRGGRICASLVAEFRTKRGRTKYLIFVVNHGYIRLIRVSTRRITAEKQIKAQMEFFVIGEFFSCDQNH